MVSPVLPRGLVDRSGANLLPRIFPFDASHICEHSGFHGWSESLEIDPGSVAFSFSLGVLAILSSSVLIARCVSPRLVECVGVLGDFRE
jgi:hypothetical protein